MLAGGTAAGSGGDKPPSALDWRISSKLLASTLLSHATHKRYNQNPSTKGKNQHTHTVFPYPSPFAYRTYSILHTWLDRGRGSVRISEWEALRTKNEREREKMTLAFQLSSENQSSVSVPIDSKRSFIISDRGVRVTWALLYYTFLPPSSTSCLFMKHFWAVPFRVLFLHFGRKSSTSLPPPSPSSLSLSLVLYVSFFFTISPHIFVWFISSFRFPATMSTWIIHDADCCSTGRQQALNTHTYSHPRGCSTATIFSIPEHCFNDSCFKYITKREGPWLCNGWGGKGRQTVGVLYWSDRHNSRVKTRNQLPTCLSLSTSMSLPSWWMCRRSGLLLLVDSSERREPSSRGYLQGNSNWLSGLLAAARRPLQNSCSKQTKEKKRENIKIRDGNQF